MQTPFCSFKVSSITADLTTVKKNEIDVFQKNRKTDTEYFRCIHLFWNKYICKHFQHVLNTFFFVTVNMLSFDFLCDKFCYFHRFQCQSSFFALMTTAKIDTNTRCRYWIPIPIHRCFLCETLIKGYQTLNCHQRNSTMRYVIGFTAL